MAIPPLNNITLFSLIHKYRSFFLRYRWQMGSGVLALVFTNLVGIAIPWQIKLSVDTIQQIFTLAGQTGQAMPSQLGNTKLLWNTFYQHLWIIAGLATLVLLCRVASRQLLLGVGRRVEFDIRNHLYQHLLKMPTAYFAAHPAGEMMSRMTNDVDATKYLTGGGIMLGVNTILAYLLVIPMMLAINWKLALVTFLFYPIVIFLMSKISKKVRQGFYDVQKYLADISTIGQENLNGMMVIQSYVREEQENQRFAKVCDQYFSTYTKLIHERILLFMLLATLSGLSTFLVLLVGGWQVIEKQLDWGGFVAFTMYLEHLSWPTMALGWTISIFQQGTAALERIDEVLSTQSNIVSPADGSESPSPVQSFKGQLEIRNLTFAYSNPYQKQSTSEKPIDNLTAQEAHQPEASVDQSTLDKNVLEEVQLSIQPGDTVAFVGSVGSGKSTLLRLLPRLMEVPDNTIFLDGQDVTRLDLETLRSAIVFMPQSNFLFSTTVSQNIALGQFDSNPDGDAKATLSPDMIHAAETASVHLDILELPKQYQTLVGERGLMLSGGQRQRVSLARALIMDATVLILDDPFSNVDAETERNIVNALHARKVFHDKTTLIATHRFSLVSLCDWVVLMDAGRIIATGTHRELLATQPLYQKLNHLQKLRSSLGDWGLELEDRTANRHHSHDLHEEDLDALASESGGQS